jgi:ABC-type polysaccharide/polyol phosphate transport system ATPase subunit
MSVRTGSTTALIGRNGSGKSTALKLVAGITKPTRARWRARPHLGADRTGRRFHPEISGRENVFINGIMLGLSKREIESVRRDRRFRRARDFIDAPVKTYSSGMYMRLGFAVAINVDPDVLLVDEVLAVGDEASRTSVSTSFPTSAPGRTVLLVTHSLGLVNGSATKRSG